MCGRYVSADEAAMERSWRIDRRNWQGWITPRFNVAPTTVVPIIRRAADGAIELLGARWGMIPCWWKKDTPPNLTFNARSEDAAEKPTWRQSLCSMRCLMPARGWYEWNEHQSVRNTAGRLVKQPYFICSSESEVISFAAAGRGGALIAAARQDFAAYPVSPRVGDSRNDSADLLDPVDGPAASD